MSSAPALATLPWQIRHPRPDEAESLLAVFTDEVRAGRMLPRSPSDVLSRPEDWLAATAGDRVIGCASLVFFDDELCEVRSLAVDSQWRNRGIGGALLMTAVHLARQRGAGRVLTLTRSVGLFERWGFSLTRVDQFPPKVWRDCTPCPLRHRCDEVALVRTLRPAGPIRRVPEPHPDGGREQTP